MKEGERLGKYLLERLFSRNERTAVFLASYEDAGWCVLKVIESPHVEFGFVAQFLSDARVAFSLDHPNLVRVTEFGSISDRAYLAMERISGVDLLRVFGEARRSGQPIPIDVVLAIACGVSEALCYIHSANSDEHGVDGFVHRNLSLPNLMLSDAGEVKVLDFGFSNAASLGESSMSRSFFGRLDYASPEHLAGEEIDGRSDVFSLGVVMHELVTGHRLFYQDGSPQRSAPGTKADIPLPSLIRRDLNPRVEDIIMRALSHDPGDRFESAHQMREAIIGISGDLGKKPGDLLAGFVADRFSDYLADEAILDVSSSYGDQEPSKEELASHQDGAVHNTESAVSPDLPVNSLVDPEAKTKKHSSWYAIQSILGSLVVILLIGAGLWVYNQERQRSPEWSLEAWRESEAGRMAEPIPVEQLSGHEEGEYGVIHGLDGEVTSRQTTKVTSKRAEKKATKRAAKRPGGSKASSPGEPITGQLLIACPSKCTVYVDGRKIGADLEGPITLPVGQKSLRVVDSDSGREHRANVIVAPGRVHVENIRFTPTFMERTGTEDW